MDVDSYFAEHPMTDASESCEVLSTPPGFRSGFVALVGRPNAGKSTLMNTLVGKKVAITSSTPQTTRTNIRGVLTLSDAQIIFVDTPGIHKPHDLLGEQLNLSASSALSDVDVVAMLIDSSKEVGKGDEWVASQVSACSAKKILILSKQDAANDTQIQQQFEAARQLAPWDAIVSLSAQSGYNTNALLEEIQQLLPEGPLWYPKDMSSDVALEMMISEIIREKVLRQFREEVPHSVGVKVDEFEKLPHLIRAEASIFVERDSQKAMLIGAKGASVKRIGSEAREDLQRLFDTKVFLGLKIKVKKNWRKDESEIRRFAYME